MPGDKPHRTSAKVEASPLGDQPDAASPAADAEGEDEAQENEVLRETRAAIAHRKPDAKKRGGVDWKAAAGLGVGSAALIAALLYANRNRK